MNGSSRICAAVGLTLGPGETVTGGEILPADLSPGDYRFTMQVVGAESYLHTRTFAVE
jgi:hypothetical protein